MLLILSSVLITYSIHTLAEILQGEIITISTIVFPTSNHPNGAIEVNCLQFGRLHNLNLFTYSFCLAPYLILDSRNKKKSHLSICLSIVAAADSPTLFPALYLRLAYTYQCRAQHLYNYNYSKRSKTDLLQLSWLPTDISPLPIITLNIP